MAYIPIKSDTAVADNPRGSSGYIPVKGSDIKVPFYQPPSEEQSNLSGFNLQSPNINLGAPSSLPIANNQNQQPFSNPLKEIYNAGADELQRAADFVESFREEGRSTSERVAKGISLISGAANVTFSPIAAVFKGADQIPGLNILAKAISLPFSAAGKGGSYVAEKALDALPFSEETKNSLHVAVKEIGGLATQIALGETAGRGLDLFAKRRELATKYGEDTANTIVEAAAKKVEEAPPSQTPAPVPTNYLSTHGQDNLAAQHLQNILTEMDIAEAGSRYSIPSEIGYDREFRSIPSTFPSFVPSELRSSKLFDSFINKITQGSTDFTPREQRLGDIVNNEIGDRLARGGFVSFDEAGKGIKENIQNARDYIEKTSKSIEVTHNLEDDLNRIRTTSVADDLRAKQLLEKTNISPKDAEAIYNYVENPKGESLTPDQAAKYQEIIKPIADARSKLFAKLRNDGLPLNNEDYTPRFVANRGGIFERIAQGVKGVFRSGLLNKSAGFFKHRVMKALVDEKGNRLVVSVKKGEVTKYEGGKATFLGRGKPADLRRGEFTDGFGKKFRIEDATTKEIEANTGVRYHKNILLNELVVYNKLRKIDRAIEFIDSFKQRENFKNIAVKFGEANTPEGWKGTNLPQFRGYAFEPRIAETFDKFYGKLQGGADPYRVLTSVNSFLRTTIFFNPLIHTPNLITHWATSRGVSKFLIPKEYVNLVKTGGRAIQAVLSQNNDYIDMLDSGVNLLYSGTKNTLIDLMTQKMGEEVQANKAILRQMSDALGYANPGKLVNAIYKFSSQATWATNDIVTMQAIYEEMGKGSSLEKAIQDVSKHIPNYRVPARVLNSRALGEIMTNSNITMFGAYHYGALKSYGEMAKSLLGKVPLKERADALDKIAMAGIIALVIYPQLDKIAQSLSGNPNTKVRRAGPITFPYNVARLATGKIDFSQLLTSVLTPAVGFKQGVELGFNRDLRTGDKLINTDQPFTDLGNFIAQSVSPISAAQRISSGKISPKDFLLSLAGVSSPKTTDTERQLTTLIFDRRPKLETKIKELYTQKGAYSEFISTIRNFNRSIFNLTKDALREGKYRPLSDNEIDSLLSPYYLRVPSEKVEQRYEQRKGLPTLEKLLNK